ncbi:DNA binding methylated-DNA--cysteine S-methyltransferase [Rhizodiscina lignyota]|uniref:DNA binding methylated-DNA--cysteine S-methyltransferase n=1 Tax=Rhizodiscina lignyota TaxID=1504668 RepID=A0A9P4IBY1_9PEZI|nr:DNA binding methylated-DNA--cysteine S-methyltransferase [Rhizodiscina lignyota]
MPRAGKSKRSQGPKSAEAAAWYYMVYSAIQQIPRGKVTSYGHIAYLVGHPERPRQVGVALKHLPDKPEDETEKPPRFHEANTPWQRVINSKGMISPRGPNGATRQATALRKEGVKVDRGSLGELMVDFEEAGWFPPNLPGEELSDEEEDDGAES